MGRIRMTRVTFGSGKHKSRTVKVHSNKKGNKNKCPCCGRFM